MLLRLLPCLRTALTAASCGQRPSTWRPARSARRDQVRAKLINSCRVLPRNAVHGFCPAEELPFSLPSSLI